MKKLEDLTIVYVNAQTLKRDPDNPRTMGVAERKMLREGLKRFGLRLPLLVRNPRDRMVIGGNQRLDICRKNLHVKRLPVIYAADLSSDEAHALGVFLNNQEAQGEYDLPALSKLVRSLPDGIRGLTGFTPDQIDRIFRGAKIENTSGFLDDIMGKVKRTTAEAAAGSTDPASGIAYFSLNYSLTKEQRAIVVRAQRVAQKAMKLKTSQDALVAIHQMYLETVDGK